MPSTRLNKVQKQIAKKKGKNASLHENSRDTQRLQRASARDDRLNRLAAIREKQNRHYILRVKAFQSYTLEHTASLTIPEMQKLIEDFLGRDDEELAKLKAERRPGRPPSTRETQLEQKQAMEQGEYTSGFWMPELDKENLKKLKLWSGKWESLPTLRFVRVTKDGRKLESSFPPKGLS
ncbi:uncharacterized protein EI97DRAFT_456872 [Westerdykella ornata]|uniref:Translation machinery-associated protein 16 n=1 Tax=Westerdykella ornata TaxID=318751 RepID=A0A6A6JPM8_WESOR|nr:uncharacterized protein EI97DRAFT_456872 [Westerdykella ornata]KAF2278482.1 hypothetical protein EI97DRAFT_456872 [Westerdykella ornata]